MSEAPAAVEWKRQADGSWRGTHQGVGEYVLTRKAVHE